MAQTSTYLNFPGNTEEAFDYYRTVFGTEYAAPIARMGDMPPQPGMPELSEADRRLVMNVQLPITAGHLLMGTDSPESMGFTYRPGNNVSIYVQPDTHAEAERLYTALGDGGAVEMPLAMMPWGAYWGSLTDRFGIQWMVGYVPTT